MMSKVGPEEKLIEAIKNEDENEALALISHGNVDINYRDRRGFTPLMHAHRYRLQPVVKKLYDLHAKVSIDQLSIMNKMFRVILDLPKENPYLNVSAILNYVPDLFDDKPTQEKKMISRALFNGLCYGFSGLMLFLSNNNKEDEFVQTLQEVAQWNGEGDSLAQHGELKEKIRRLYDNVFFLAWLHSHTMISETNPALANLTKFDLDKLINLTLDPHQIKYQKEYTFALTFKESELQHFYDKTIFNNKMVRLNFGSSHWISVVKKADGFHYYDPESPEGIVVLKSTQELADATVNSYLSYFSQFDKTLIRAPNNLYEVGFVAYDKVNAEKENYPAKDQLLEEILLSRGIDTQLDRLGASNICNTLELVNALQDKELLTALLKKGIDVNATNAWGFPVILSPDMQETVESFNRTKKSKM